MPKNGMRQGMVRFIIEKKSAGSSEAVPTSRGAPKNSRQRARHQVHSRADVRRALEYLLLVSDLQAASACTERARLPGNMPGKSSLRSCWIVAHRSSSRMTVSVSK